MNVVRTVTYRGYDITKVIVGYAYARNGNLGNPTPQVQWYADKVPSRTLREAKEFVDMLIAETGSKT